jgi:hypothetical protein
MIVSELCVGRSFRRPAKANAVRVVDPHALLTLAITCQIGWDQAFDPSGAIPLTGHAFD